MDPKDFASKGDDNMSETIIVCPISGEVCKHAASLAALLRECRDFMETAPMSRDATVRKHRLIDAIDALDGAKEATWLDAAPPPADAVTDEMVEAAWAAAPECHEYGDVAVVSRDDVRKMIAAAQAARDTK
jgi:hypothetical protein